MSIGLTMKASKNSVMEQTVESDSCCQHCGTALNQSKLSMREIVMNSFTALLLLAIMLPLGWQLDKAAQRCCHHFLHHLVWREPVEDWNR